ncbi:hypothetical protein RchiOBHm_Chr2g0105391 [Rosa chinensis]|uniref:Uncharacterized protein n=1 Tax=Rosa chinensis TaxID=74649 RepID=A0A2P6RNJ7_ROSCH|nr:hypothetical protein RchiOBHm_Chr2g0105391 [Rosa chinensis]
MLRCVLLLSSSRCGVVSPPPPPLFALHVVLIYCTIDEFVLQSTRRVLEFHSN